MIRSTSSDRSSRTCPLIAVGSASFVGYTKGRVTVPFVRLGAGTSKLAKQVQHQLLVDSRSHKCWRHFGDSVVYKKANLGASANVPNPDTAQLDGRSHLVQNGLPATRPDRSTWISIGNRGRNNLGRNLNLRSKSSGHPRKKMPISCEHG